MASTPTPQDPEDPQELIRQLQARIRALESATPAPTQPPRFSSPLHDVHPPSSPPKTFSTPVPPQEPSKTPAGVREVQEADYDDEEDVVETGRSNIRLDSTSDSSSDSDDSDDDSEESSSKASSGEESSDDEAGIRKPREAPAKPPPSSDAFVSPSGQVKVKDTSSIYHLDKPAPKKKRGPVMRPHAPLIPSLFFIDGGSKLF